MNAVFLIWRFHLWLYPVSDIVPHTKLVFTLHSFIRSFSHLRNIYLVHGIPGTMTSRVFPFMCLKQTLKGLLINYSSRKEIVIDISWLSQVTRMSVYIPYPPLPSGIRRYHHPNSLQWPHLCQTPSQYWDRDITAGYRSILWCCPPFMQP